LRSLVRYSGFGAERYGFHALLTVVRRQLLRAIASNIENVGLRSNPEPGRSALL
jgi:hypothetical protein